MEKSSVAKRTGADDAVARILERTIEVISTQGETAIRTNPIAYECGSTPPVLYRAFGSREGLVIAAQAERYRRTMEDVIPPFATEISAAGSKEELRTVIETNLRNVYGRSRSRIRRVRAEVIGAAVARPELAERIVEVDRDATEVFVTALEKATAAGWVPGGDRLRAIIMWTICGVNTRMNVEFDSAATYGDEWKEIAVQAVLHVTLGD